MESVDGNISNTIGPLDQGVEKRKTLPNTRPARDVGSAIHRTFRPVDRGTADTTTNISAPETSSLGKPAFPSLRTEEQKQAAIHRTFRPTVPTES